MYIYIKSLCKEENQCTLDFAVLTKDPGFWGG